MAAVVGPRDSPGVDHSQGLSQDASSSVATKHGLVSNFGQSCEVVSSLKAAIHATIIAYNIGIASKSVCVCRHCAAKSGRSLVIARSRRQPDIARFGLPILHPISKIAMCMVSLCVNN